MKNIIVVADWFIDQGEKLVQFLNDHKENIISITEVYMPKIGCGLDRLSWPAVKEQLKYVFGDSEVTFNVYYL